MHHLRYAGAAGNDEMQVLAADLGYSETAFLRPRGDREFDVRYFSPLAEVPFLDMPSSPPLSR
ncbi:MAG: PhzF family phenazine biosynthesis protein [Actinomycetota bacterium]|nr:PhzF family phenazine biosynthesis protein [Actinomycetota bacterium]